MRQNFSRSGLSGFSRRKQSAIGRFSLPSNELGPLVEVVDTADLKSAARLGRDGSSPSEATNYRAIKICCAIPLPEQKR